MRNLFLSLIGVGLFIVFVGQIMKTQRGEKTFLTPYFHFGVSQVNPTPVPNGLPNLKKITVGKTVIQASIADTSLARQKGLGGVASMAQDQGMLFVFDRKNLSPQEARFWMKDMLIPLDFIWITNGKVSEITPNVPAPALNTPDSKLQIYQPSVSIDYVLEVNAGFASKNNIKVGDTVILN